MTGIALLTGFGFDLLQGALTSLAIAFFAISLGLVGGTLLALLLMYGHWSLRLVGNIYVNLIRGTPMLVQIVMLFYILPQIGVMLPAFWAAVLAIGLNSIAYVSQTIRAGIQSVGKGQIEAAKTLGFSRRQTIKLIILPQAFRAVLPAFGNESITLIKDTSLASVIGVAELTHQGSIIMSRTYDALTAYAGVAIIYLLLTGIAALVIYLLEKRLA